MFLFLSGVRALLLRVGATTPAYLVKKSKENLNSGVEKPRNLGQPDGGKNRDLLKNSTQIVCLKRKRENERIIFNGEKKIRKQSKTRCIFCNAKWPHKITWHKKQDIPFGNQVFLFPYLFFHIKVPSFCHNWICSRKKRIRARNEIVDEFFYALLCPSLSLPKGFFSFSPYIRL